jgi:hypothetical protein
VLLVPEIMPLERYRRPGEQVCAVVVETAGTGKGW